VLEGDGTYTYSQESHTYYSVKSLPFSRGWCYILLFARNIQIYKVPFKKDTLNVLHVRTHAYFF
jgi:hypothetical protein